MPKEITITKTHLIITIPLDNNRYNPYDEEYKETMDNIIGLYEGEYNNGLCYKIDMGYKDKQDQYTDYFYKCNIEKKEFEEICKKLNIEAIYNEIQPNSNQKS